MQRIALKCLRQFGVMRPVLLTVGIILGGTELQGQQSEFFVIVNAANNVSELSMIEVSHLFLKRVTSWEGGAGVVPVDLPQQSAVRQRFTKDVHGKTVDAIQAYWQREVFSGRQVPPVQRASSEEVVAFVTGNQQAVGYVSHDVSLPSGVKAVRINNPGTAGTIADAREEVHSTSTVDELPRAMSVPPIRYPSTLRRARVEGHVIIQFVVDRDGRVEANSISVLESSNSAFETPAIEVVRRTVFQPGRVAGRAVAVLVQQKIQFALSGRRGQ